MTAGGSQPKLYDAVSKVLRYGTILSAIVLALGLAGLLLNEPAEVPRTVQSMLSSGFGAPTLDPAALMSGLASGSPLNVLEVGTLVLLATPLSRVAASVVLFAKEKDRTYVAITLLVLTMLLFAIFVLGPVESRA